MITVKFLLKKPAVASFHETKYNIWTALDSLKFLYQGEILFENRVRQFPEFSLLQDSERTDTSTTEPYLLLSAK